MSNQNTVFAVTGVKAGLFRRFTQALSLKIEDIPKSSTIFKLASTFFA
jgi:hypothetical protein